MPSASITDHIRLLVYDLDGTLVDAFGDIWRCMNITLDRCGLEPLPFEQVKAGVGDGTERLVERCLGEAHADRFDEVHQTYIQVYHEQPSSEARLYEGVGETLRRLASLGVAQAVLTNKPEAITLETCRKLGIADSLDAIRGAVAGRPLKPDPATLLELAEAFGVPVEQTAMVGDYRADCLVAKNAGTRLIGVTWGLFDRDELKRYVPDAIIDAMNELPALVRSEANE